MDRADDSPLPPGVTVVGQDNWLAYVEEARRTAATLDQKVAILDLYRAAVDQCPASLKLWLSYCEYFWSLYQTFNGAQDSQVLGREVFTLESALSLWTRAYSAVTYRLADSHELWNRWAECETEQIEQQHTPERIRRVFDMYCARLLVPHCAWDATSQAFSAFVSKFCPDRYETAMSDVVRDAQAAKAIMAARDRFEDRLRITAADVDEHRAVMKEYLDWELTQRDDVLDTKQQHRHRGRDAMNARKHLPSEGLDEVSIYSCGLCERAVTDAFAFDPTIWLDYISYLSQVGLNAHQTLPILHRAVQHCPYSGPLWSAYLLCGEEAGLPLADMNGIKQTATADPAQWPDTMDGLLDVYMAWCDYLCRRVKGARKSAEAAALARAELLSALKIIAREGRRRYAREYRGDPAFRLDRIWINYLTDQADIAAAQTHWDLLASKDLHALSYYFWLHYFDWEMRLHFSVDGTAAHSPASAAFLERSAGGTSASTAALGIAPQQSQHPLAATRLLFRALQRPRELDWPEKLLDVCLRHCHDYETPAVIRHAVGKVHALRKAVAKRREREAAAGYEAQQAARQHEGAEEREQEHDQERDQEHDQDKVHVQAPVHGQQQQEDDLSPQRLEDASPGLKRKRLPGGSQGQDCAAEHKRSKPAEIGADEQPSDQVPKRDREHTSVLVTGLPVDVTQTKIKHYFKDYGHVSSLGLSSDPDGNSASAVIEFRSREEAQSALLRDAKYFGQTQIAVRPAHGLTLYVTNYPPDADEARIRALFSSQSSSIIAVRFPSLKFNTHRRFCYVSFRDPASAAAATGIDSTVLPGGYRLVVKVSDPAAKKTRDGAVAEARELHLSDLPPTAASEDFLRGLCSRHGSVASVTVPVSMAGRPLGFAYVVFDQPAAAAAAVADLHLATLKGAVISAQLSRRSLYKPTAHHTAPAPSPSGPASIASRTLAISGIPDTVNDARLTALLAPHGAVTKLVLRPAKGSASVEFDDPAAVGRAALSLDGYVLNGATLRAFAPVTTTTASAFVPTAALRRPTPARAGRRGRIAATPRVPAPAQSDGAPTASKTNADFRAMVAQGRDPGKDASGGPADGGQAGRL